MRLKVARLRNWHSHRILSNSEVGLNTHEHPFAIVVLHFFKIESQRLCFLLNTAQVFNNSKSSTLAATRGAPSSTLSQDSQGIHQKTGRDHIKSCLENCNSMNSKIPWSIGRSLISYFILTWDIHCLRDKAWLVRVSLMDEPVIPEALLRSVDGSALSASGSQGVWSRLGQRWNDGPMVCTWLAHFLLEPTGCVWK